MTIKRFLLAGLLLPAAWSQGLRAQSAPPPSFGETMEVNVVNVEVYVTDKAGRRAGGLKKDDFTVFEDGRKVEISNFEAVERRVETAAATAAPAPAAGRESAPAPPPPAGPAPAIDPESRLSLVVFIDNLHLRSDHRTRAVEQIRKFLAGTVRPGDRVMLVTYDTGLRTRQTFTDDRGALDAALRNAETLPAFGQQEDQNRRTAFESVVDLHKVQPCDIAMIKPVEAYATQVQQDALRSIGALRVTINSLSGIPGRKAVLYVSDGVSITPGEELFEAAADLCNGKMATLGLPTVYERHAVGAADDGGFSPEQAALEAQKYSVAKKLEDLAAHASADRVTFYTLQASGLTGLAAADAGFDATERLLQTTVVQQIQTTNLRGSLNALAADTGGRAMLDANDFLSELGRMQEDFESYYSLGYTPPHTGDGKVHKVEVKLKRPGLRVRYRQSYRDKPPLERVADRTLAALYYGIEDNPLGIAIEIGDQAAAESGQYSVPVQLRIPLFKLAILNQQESFQGKLRILVAVRDEQGSASPLRMVEVPLNIPRKEVLSAMGQYYVYTLTLKMKPGSQHVAVAVRDELAAATSYLSRAVMVGGAPPRTASAGHP